MRPPQSLWWSTLDEPSRHEHHSPATSTLTSRSSVEVITGLWTARELKRRDPELRIAVLEKSVCGFGASGRNGGWASALFPLGDEAVLARYGPQAFEHQRTLLRHAVGELGESIRAERIDAHFIKGGSLTFARNPVQEARLRQKSTVRENRVLTRRTFVGWTNTNSTSTATSRARWGPLSPRTARASTRRVSLGD